MYFVVKQTKKHRLKDKTLLILLQKAAKTGLRKSFFNLCRVKHKISNSQYFSQVANRGLSVCNVLLWRFKGL